tara:strand:+ start:3102 stop:3383 length:282 start_codon:yes stop_codon:yes gene_type:complete
MGKPIDTLSLIRSLQDKLDTQVGYKEDYRVSYMGAMDDLHTARKRIKELTEALQSCKAGWLNLIEIDVLPEGYRATAARLAEDCREALEKKNG